MVLVTFRRVADPKLRVLAVPYAGAGPAWLRPLDSLFPADVELSVIAQDKRASSMTALIAAIAPELPSDRPFVLYGHSIGAWIAFELARACPEQCRALVVSGRSSPDGPRRGAPINRLPDAAFVAEMIARYDAIPQAVLESPGLLAATLPMLRADMAVGETYAPAPGPLLEVPIHVYGGSADVHVLAEDLEGWRRMTRAETTVDLRAGGHFFVDDPSVRQEICARLSGYR